MNKTDFFGIVTVFLIFYVLSFIHPKMIGIEVKLQGEVVPDILVSYRCNNYKRLDNLHMVDKGKTVTINYGGLGRRKGLRTLTCLDI